MPARVKAFLIHLCCSVAVALLLAWVVFGVWYPVPLDKAVGVRSIFLLVLAVDAVLGPTVTLIIYKPGKKGLVMDLWIIVFLQIFALAYGLHTVAVGRPVWIVFNVDRFDVVRAYEVDTRHLDRAAPEFQRTPWGSPRWVSAEKPEDPETQQLILAESLEGGPDLAQRPEHYQPLSAAHDQIVQRAKALIDLEKSNEQGVVQRVLSASPKAVAWLPLMSSEEPMVVLLDGNYLAVGIVDLRPW